MSVVLYHILVLGVAAFAVLRGFRMKFSRQLPTVIGTAFGIVCARIFTDPLADVLRGAFPWIQGEASESFTYGIVAASLVFLAVYAVFRTVTSFLLFVFKNSDSTILDNIGGSLFTLFEYMLLVSMAYNIILGFDSDSILLKSMKSDDGNIVEEVMLLAPTVLGCEGPDELAHRIQLEEAKKISINDFSLPETHPPLPVVIDLTGSVRG